MRYGYCGTCRGFYTVREDGTMRKHENQRTPLLLDENNRLSRTPCSGSGQPPRST